MPSVTSATGEHPFRNGGRLPDRKAFNDFRETILKKSGMWRALTAVAVAGAAVLAGAAPAAADERPSRVCAPGELSVQIAEGHSPHPKDRLFVIAFRAHKGVSCLLGGALDYIRFYDTSKRPLDVRFTDKDAVAPFDQVLVEDWHGPVVYVAAPAGDGGLPIGSMAFSVPTAPESEMAAAWPAPVRGPLRLTKIVQPAS